MSKHGPGEVCDCEIPAGREGRPYHCAVDDEFMRSNGCSRPDMAHRRIEDLGHLAELLGGSVDSFTGDLLRLLVKAQATPSNFVKLRKGFPREVLAWEIWNELAEPTGARVWRALIAIESGNTAVFLEDLGHHTGGRDLVRAMLIEDLDERLHEPTP